ncbi:SAP domain protein [Cooperia oncophora]
MTEVGEQKLLSELRVTELKQELEKRNLDKNGIKIILTDRLEKKLIARTDWFATEGEACPCDCIWHTAKPIIYMLKLVSDTGD